MTELRWKFSVRSLLQLTAVLSLVLAFAVNLPGVFTFLLVVAALVVLVATIMASANFATSARRPRLAIIAWMLLGVFFAIYATALLRVLFQGEVEIIAGPILGILVMGGCSLVCVLNACRSYLQSGKSERETGGEYELAATNSDSAESQSGRR